MFTFVPSDDGASFRRVRRGRLPAVAVLLCLAQALRAGPAGASPREVFLAKHRCPVVAMLNEIHRRGPVNTSHERFIVVSVADQMGSYVQCIFTDRESAMYCEASSAASAALLDTPYEFRLPRDVPSALQRLGYRQEDPKENFSRIVELGMPPDVGAAADLMLTALFDAYGARAFSILRITAPRAKNAVIACGTPLS